MRHLEVSVRWDWPFWPGTICSVLKYRLKGSSTGIQRTEGLWWTCKFRQRKASLICFNVPYFVPKSNWDWRNWITDWKGYLKWRENGKKTESFKLTSPKIGPQGWKYYTEGGVAFAGHSDDTFVLQSKVMINHLQSILQQTARRDFHFSLQIHLVFYKVWHYDKKWLCQACFLFYSVNVTAWLILILRPLTCQEPPFINPHTPTHTFLPC